jgi:hypothetical protein
MPKQQQHAAAMEIEHAVVPAIAIPNRQQRRWQQRA